MKQRASLLPMRRLLPTLALLLAALPAWGQQSALLESVRQNPQRGKALCQQLRQLNAQGISFTANQVTTIVAREQNLSPTDAEVVLTYVVGFHCPDVR
jgi:hypothetical protein